MDIKSVIRKYGFTVNSLATKHGVGQSRLNQMVNGNPSAKNLEWLASLIGCSPAEFFADWQGAGSEAANNIEKAELQEKAEAAAEEKHDELPFNGNAADAPERQQAEAVRAVRFAYQCPVCGANMKVCISPE